ncbi:hypothetical protein Tco_0741327 [Tanacetum coccineum]
MSFIRHQNNNYHDRESLCITGWLEEDNRVVEGGAQWQRPLKEEEDGGGDCDDSGLLGFPGIQVTGQSLLVDVPRDKNSALCRLSGYKATFTGSLNGKRRIKKKRKADGRQFYGQPPTFHDPYIAGTSNVEMVDRTLATREEAINLLKFHLRRAQDRMKAIADQSRIDR